MRNRFKGLDLIDRVPDEQWTEVHNTVQKTRFKTVPKKKKCKIANWLSEEALQIAVKRIEAKGKGEKERYIHLNAEFQRIARRDKKAFRSDQCKEIEENNRLGKTRLWDFPGKNSGVGCHFLLQGIFPTQGSNSGLLHCRQMLYHLSHQGSS